MRRKPIHFDNAGAAAPAAIAEVNFDAAKISAALADITSVATDDKSADDKTVDTNDVEGKTTEGVVIDKNNDAAAVADDKKTADDKSVNETDENNTDELTVPALSEEQQEDTWITAGARLGLADLTDPEDFTAVEKGVQEKYKSEYERGKTEGKAESQNLELETTAPDAIPVINALKAGVPFKDILVPLQGYNSALALSPDQRLTNYYTQVLKMTPDAAADQIAVLENSGTKEAEDAKIVVALETARDNHFAKIVGEGNALYQKKIADDKIKNEAENKSIKEAIRSRTDFMGAPVTEAHYTALEKIWDSGTYKKLMASDPQAVADFIYFKEFGVQRTKQLVDKTKKDTKLEVIKRQSNSGTQQSGTKTAPQKGDMDANPHFDLEAIQQGLDESRKKK